MRPVFLTIQRDVCAEEPWFQWSYGRCEFCSMRQSVCWVSHRLCSEGIFLLNNGWLSTWAALCYCSRTSQAVLSIPSLVCVPYYSMQFGDNSVPKKNNLRLHLTDKHPITCWQPGLVLHVCVLWNTELLSKTFGPLRNFLSEKATFAECSSLKSECHWIVLSVYDWHKVW